MATIPQGTKFLGVDPTFTDLTEKKGIKVDRKTEYFSLEDLADSLSSGSSSVKGVLVEISESEILNTSGFSKTLVSAIPGKILVPQFVSVYRKPGGTNYSLFNSVRLNSVVGSSSSTIGNAIDSPFTSSTEGTLNSSFAFAINSSVKPNNSLMLISGSFTSPSTITGGTGNIVVYMTYTEITIS